MTDVLEIKQAAIATQDAASLGKRGRDVVDAAEHQLEDDRVERAVAEGQPRPPPSTISSGNGGGSRETRDSRARRAPSFGSRATSEATSGP